MCRRIGKHCKQQYSYGLCEYCDKCGCVTRNKMYDKVRESSHKLYADSKKCIEDTEKILDQVTKLNSDCEWIIAQMNKYWEYGGNVKELSKEIKHTLKTTKRLSKPLKEFMKQVEKVDQIASTIENRIDY